jgi:hypothetical protein
VVLLQNECIALCDGFQRLNLEVGRCKSDVVLSLERFQCFDECGTDALKPICTSTGFTYSSSCLARCTNSSIAYSTGKCGAH